ncbi:zf-HC2 domain-containing protein [Slackia heliotrinireducens]|uniref:zf-HC2 domain-containing protein n=1 Tax=Slackia heliotrinireducens TaxID=84110 RepID=UPI003315ACE5
MSKKKSEAPDAAERVQESAEQAAEQGETAMEEADDGRAAAVDEDPVEDDAAGLTDEAEGQVGERAQGVGPDGADVHQAAEVSKQALDGFDGGVGVPAEPSKPGSAEAADSVCGVAAAEASATGQVVTCGVVRDLLPLYVDDVVGAETRAMVDAHLQSCAGCQGYLDGMNSVVQIPVAPKQGLEDAKVLRGLKRFIRNKRLLTGLGTAVAVLVACCLAVGLMNSYEWDVPYSEDINVYQNGDGYVNLQYTGAGHVMLDSYWDEAGVMNVSCRQSFWDRYVEPIYDNGMDEFVLSDSFDIIEVRYYDTPEGMYDADAACEVVWEADEQAKHEFYERQRNNEQASEDLEELYRQQQEIVEQIWVLEAEQEGYTR